MEDIDTDTAALLDRAAAEMQQRRAEIIRVKLSLSEAVGIIGNLQLAFRHPGNVGPTRVQTEELARRLIERLDPQGGDLYQVLMHGFDQEFDL